jgi:hypothetical protein
MFSLRSGRGLVHPTQCYGLSSAVDVPSRQLYLTREGGCRESCLALAAGRRMWTYGRDSDTIPYYTAIRLPLRNRRTALRLQCLPA